jgi:hypothetical protein
MGGRDRIGARVDRVLRGEASAPAAPLRTIVAAAACLVTIAGAAACRGQSPQRSSLAALEESLRNDPDALVSVSQALLATPSAPGSGSADRDRLAELYLARAMQLDPNPQLTIQHTQRLAAQGRLRRKRLRLANTPLLGLEKVAAGLDQPARVDFLIDSLTALVGTNWVEKTWDDVATKDYAAVSANLSRTFANSLLTLAPKIVSHPRYGTAINRAHMVLASLAWRDHDRAGALQQLDEAGRAPVSEELIYGRGQAGWPILRDLIEAGERPAVVEYLDRMAATSLAEGGQLRDWAAAISRGETPRLPNWTVLLF